MGNAKISASILKPGTYANIPSSAADGQEYQATDGPRTKFVRVNGVWRPYVGGRLCTSPPAAANWTLVNAGAATLTDSGGNVVFQAPYANSTSINRRLAVRSLPATPFTLTCGFNMNLFPPGAGQNSLLGIIYRDSASQRYVNLSIGWATSFYNSVQKFNSVTSFNSDYGSYSGWPMDVCRRVYLHLHDPGGSGNLDWRVSGDGNFNNAMTLWNTSSRTDFTASPNQIGIFLSPENTDPRGKVTMDLFDWTIE